MNGPMHCDEKEKDITAHSRSASLNKSLAEAPTFDKGSPAKQPTMNLVTAKPAYVGDKTEGICRIANKKMLGMYIGCRP